MQSGIKRKRYLFLFGNNGVDDRFLNGHVGSVTFVGVDKLNKTLVSAGSDGLILVSPFLSVD
jgi:hypothetical protein